MHIIKPSSLLTIVLAGFPTTIGYILLPKNKLLFLIIIYFVSLILIAWIWYTIQLIINNHTLQKLNFSLKENNNGLIENNARIKNEREQYRKQSLKMSRLLTLFFSLYSVPTEEINNMKAIEETTNVENN